MTAIDQVESHQGDHRDDTIVVNIDNEDFRLPDRTTTPRALLEVAGKTPDEAYLVAINGRHQTSYKDRHDEEIKVHKHQRFITVAVGPTPVS